MANPGLSPEQKLDTKDRVEQKLREGFRPPNLSGVGMAAIRAAAHDAVRDKVVGSLNSFVSRVECLTGTEYEPDWSAYRSRQYLHNPPGSPTIVSQDHVTEDEPEGPIIRVAVIGDAHDSPHLRDKSRFRWLGEYIAEHGFERVVSVGDWMTMDCFSTHTDRATFEGLSKPTFQQDLDSMHESQRAFQEGLAGHRPIKDITFGNHEARAWKYDNFHPDGASHVQMLEEAFAQWGWRTTPYGEYRFIGGVGFTHVPQNARGKPQSIAQNRATAAMFDTIHGDDHRSTTDVAFKSGPIRSPTVYSAATALPCGYIEGFANKGGSTWRSGICEATIWGGHVRKWAFTEMVLLRKQYGERLAA
jgi:hypothetical protein